MRVLFAYLVFWLPAVMMAQTNVSAVSPPKTITGSDSHNYVSKAVFTQKVKKMTSVAPAKAVITTTFYDGFGRKQQTVLRNNNSGKDLADYYVYDNRGRVVRQYLPGAIAGSGNFATLGRITESHSSLYPQDATDAYTSIGYDESVTPQDVTTHRPGIAWKASAGTRSRHEINKTFGKYSCHKYAFSTATGSLEYHRTYPTGRLHVTSVTDEDGRETIIFKDFNDSTYLLRRVLDDNTFADTYYIYDRIGNVRYVIPPMASASLSAMSAGAIPDDNATIQDYCYIYKYDSRNRLEEKKLPGAGPVYYAYDACDLLRYSQDGNQRTRGQWTAYAYDNMFRLAYSCEVGLDSLTATQLRQALSQIDSKTEYTGEDGALNGYSNAIPYGTVTSVNVINYYDKYNFLERYQDARDSLEYQVERNYDWRHIDSVNPRQVNLGMLTGSAVMVMGDTLLLPRANYYDRKGRLVQSCERNHLGGYDRKMYRLSFVGNPISMRHEHSSAQTSCVDIYTYSYDIQLRPTAVSLSHNGGEAMLEVSNFYNELGQLSSQTLGEGLIETAYQYNIQGWTTNIDNLKFHQQLHYDNNPYGGEGCLTGNVCAMSWSSDGHDSGGNLSPTIMRTYKYGYDNLDRLTSAQYVEEEPRSGFTYVTTNTPDYSTAYTYDLNGNITSLRRNGLVSRELADSYELWTFGEVDNVEMTHDGNHTQKISDATEEVVLSSSMDLTDWELDNSYDSNGNLTRYADKDIWQITYNRLNLPEMIVFEGNDRIRFKYDTSGRKLCEIYELYHLGVPPSFELEPMDEGESMTASGYYTTASRRDYCGNHIYQNGSLSMVITPAGYIAGGMRYYYLKDYQGNNRVVLNQNGVVKQINHYYPYGSLMGEGYNASSQPYRYGGKELVTLGGLNLSDFDARWLDSPSGSFTTMDPLCENFYATSPYLYCAANPIKYIDPTGMDIWEINNRGEIVSHLYNDNEDRFIMVNDDGRAKINEDGYEVSISFEYGTIISHKSSKYLANNEIIDVDIFKVRGDENGENLFKFLSDNVTTPDVGIEYSLFQTGLSGSRGLNFVSTSHTPGADASGSILYEYQLKYGYFIRKHIHSHPVGRYAGDKDRRFILKINENIFKIYQARPSFYIYHVPTSQFINYKP